MQRATVDGVHLKSPADARVIFHSVFLNIFPMVTRRLNTEEKRQITTGSVYVWEEKGRYAKLPGASFERWTDGIGWGPSMLRDEFLVYREQPRSLEHLHTESLSPRPLLNKKTYCVYIDIPGGRRKWHLVAYFTDETVVHLRDVRDIPQLATLAVPQTKYKCARIGKGIPEPILTPESESRGVALEHAPYVPGTSSPIALPTPQHHFDPWPNALLRNGSVPHQSDAASTNTSDDVREESLHREALTPLSYLQGHPPARRHPVDEKMLMLLNSREFCNSQPQMRWGKFSLYQLHHP